MKKEPQTAMLGHGYHAADYHGSMKQPIYQTSTYEFPNSQAGKDYFAWATGKEEMPDGAKMGNIYSRLGSPNTQLLEQRLAVLDGTEDALVFASGMAVISATMLELATPNTVFLYTAPVYGGTHSFIDHYLHKYGVIHHVVEHDKSAEEVVAEVTTAYPGLQVCAFFTETPANPTMDLYSVKKARKIADALGSEEHPVPVVVDNTYLGPTMSRQHENGADIVVYSVTKNLAGHSDVIAGAATGKTAWINRLRVARTFIGGILGPMDSWLILRSLETFTLRIAAQQKTTHEVAAALAQHTAVKEVRYLGNLEQWSPGQAAFFKDEYQGTGSMIALHIHGDESAAFKVLDHLKVFRLGVSLGSTESLAEHPYSMTHSKVDDLMKVKLGITEGLIRLSIGLEAPGDLIDDLNRSLDTII